MSGRLRAVLIAGCAVLSALHVGEARDMLAQGFWGPYARGDTETSEVSRRPGDAGVALREIEPYLGGLGVGL